MTIGIGMLCAEGVLICADTEHNAWAEKSHESKVHSFGFPGGRVLYAYAGHTQFATAAMQACERRLNAVAIREGFDPRKEIERLLDKEYRRNVSTNPNATSGELAYRFLIALSYAGRVRLFATLDTAMPEVLRSECIGIGEFLAKCLLRTAYSGTMEYRHVLPLAAYTLASVKENVRDCDGVSVFGLLEPNGNVSITTSQDVARSYGRNFCADVERLTNGFDFTMKRIFFHLTDLENGEYFEANLNNELESLRGMFRKLFDGRKSFERELAKLNPSLTSDQVARLAAQASMGLSPDQPPSPESRGETDES